MNLLFKILTFVFLNTTLGLWTMYRWDTNVIVALQTENTSCLEELADLKTIPPTCKDCGYPGLTTTPEIIYQSPLAPSEVVEDPFSRPATFAPPQPTAVHPPIATPTPKPTLTERERCLNEMPYPSLCP